MRIDKDLLLKAIDYIDNEEHNRRTEYGQHILSELRSAVAGYEEDNFRYFIGADNSGHDYLVPVSFRQEWNDFCELDEEDPASWDVPDWAIKFEGDLTFSDPQF